MNVECSTFPAQRGVALVVTLIMLAVITFMTVTFLVMSTREKGAVTTATDQTIARLAADSAFERAKAELLAGILSTTNAANYGLLVSTNFVNPGGFTPGAVFDPRTNINFDYRSGGGLLNAADRLQNLANLLYDPRVPVAITNRQLGSNEFRFFINLNRNLRSLTNVFDPTGFQPVLDASGNLVAASPDPGFVTNYFVGDPQWIGGLERPNLTHSSTNKFLYRYAFLAVPSGQTLDVNYAHNQAHKPNAQTLDKFGQEYFRNQGAGTWELNLASFLSDLNTNMYAFGGQYTSYLDPITGAITWGGNPFVDAMELYRYRLNGPRKNALSLYTPVDYAYADTRFSVFTLYGNLGVDAFKHDFIDGYSAGPLVRTNGNPFQNDPDLFRTAARWSGADNPYHFFTTQELFDPAKTSPPFVGRLSGMGTNLSSYDQNTFYRMLAQLGTDSAPDDADKLNLNYKNINGLSATNFVAWTPEDFFTNAANRLLSRYTQEWYDTDTNAFQYTFGTNAAFGIDRIPVWVSNRWAYTPSVHRILQLAANIGDASTNRANLLGADFPSVFKPVFQRQGNNLYIVGYESVGAVSGTADARFSIPRDLSDTSQVALVQPNDNVYGVPWIIAAKKGFPNFNEVGMKTVFEVTRKLQITRSDASAKLDKRPSEDPTARTNVLFVMGVSSELGVEVWNSYASNYNRAVDIAVTADLSMMLTNSYGYKLGLPPNFISPVVTNILAGAWPGNKIDNDGSSPSFQIPLRTNIAFLPVQAYRFPPLAAGFTTNWDLAWDKSQTFPQPQWGLLVTNRMRIIMLDTLTKRVIDYVQLGNLTATNNLSEVVRDPDDADQGYTGLWKTNNPSNPSIPYGIVNQINVSRGNYGFGTSDWISATKVKYDKSVQDEIEKFKALYHMGTWPTLKNTNTVVQVPFTPTKRYSQYLTWQANDPLVHYTAQDLTDLAGSGPTWGRLSLQVGYTNGESLYNLGIGKVFGRDGVATFPDNRPPFFGRYQPWGFRGDSGEAASKTDIQGKTRYDVALKDPLVRSSDDWEFPTNKFPSLGWLGRVHRGTPWQTVYMKADDLGVASLLNTNPAPALFTNTTYWVTNLNPAVAKSAAIWAIWSGNANATDSFFARPASDRLMFDLFTTAFNDNAVRGQLSINQANLAAWSAVFAGAVALTNSSTPTQLQATPPIVRFDPVIIPPAGAFDAFDTNVWPVMMKLVTGINRERSNLTNHPSQTFEHLGDILSVPELTGGSPFLNTNGLWLQKGLNDQVYEWLPQQVMSLLRLGEPRFVIYSYGQALRPADNSVYTAGGAFFGMVTNYQIAAEVATRAVVRVEGSPDPTKTDPNLPAGKRYPPRIVVENYNLLPPD